MTCLMRCGMRAMGGRDICAGCASIGKGDGPWRDGYVARGGRFKADIWPTALRVRQQGLINGAKSRAEAAARREAA